MKLFLAIFACVFLAINANEECDLKPVIEAYGSCKASIIELTGGCNGLECERGIVARANISLREDPNELDNYVDELVCDLEESAGSRDVSDCQSIIDELKNIKCEVRDQINCIVDDLVADLEDEIDRTEQSIEDKERSCNLLQEANDCNNEICVGLVALKISKAKTAAVLSIKASLSQLSDNIQSKIECAASDIAKAQLDGMDRARCLAEDAQKCIDDC